MYHLFMWTKYWGGYCTSERGDNIKVKLCRHNEEINDLKSLPNIIRFIKLTMTRQWNENCIIAVIHLCLSDTYIKLLCTLVVYIASCSGPTVNSQLYEIISMFNDGITFTVEMEKNNLIKAEIRQCIGIEHNRRENRITDPLHIEERG